MNYVIYFMKADRGIEHGMQFWCADDEQATNFVLGLVATGPRELWCGGRRVSTIREKSVEAPLHS